MSLILADIIVSVIPVLLKKTVFAKKAKDAILALTVKNLIMRIKTSIGYKTKPLCDVPKNFFILYSDAGGVKYF